MPFPGSKFRECAVWVRRASLFALGAPALILSSESSAGVTRYGFEVPDRLDAAYEVPLDVRYAGRVVVESEWGGGRILSFRLEGAGSPPVRLLRSGPSPQRIEADIAEGSPSIGAPWRLLIRALPGRGATQVSLSVELPDPPGSRVPAPQEKSEIEPHRDEPPLPSWARPAAPELGRIPSLAPLTQSIERFRAAVVGASGEFVADPCSWHGDFLRWAASARDTLGSTTEAPDHAGAACLVRWPRAVRRVDAFRSSADPLIAGPVPSDARERIIWRARRGDVVRPLEEELDSLLTDSRKAECDALADEVWPARFTACLIACERYFEERVRLGDEAANAELARTEWSRYLEAAEILEALTAPPPAPAANSE